VLEKCSSDSSTDNSNILCARRYVSMIIGSDSSTDDSNFWLGKGQPILSVFVQIPLRTIVTIVHVSDGASCSVQIPLRTIVTHAMRFTFRSSFMFRFLYGR